MAFNQFSLCKDRHNAVCVCAVRWKITKFLERQEK